MVLEGVLDAIGRLVGTGARNDDDLPDRVNHRYTVILLSIFTVIVTATQYVGSPIHCWSPAYFTDSHAAFADNVCWIANTYYLPTAPVPALAPGSGTTSGLGQQQTVWREQVPGQPGVIKRHIGYYQWVPLMLLAQAFLFHLPCLFWRMLNDRSGVNINNLVEAAETIQNALYPERREKTIKYMIRHLDHYLEYQHSYRAGCCACVRDFLSRGLCCFRIGNRHGNYLVALYASTKILYIVNVVAQLFILDVFLGAGYHLFGAHVVADAIAGTRPPLQRGAGSRRFPTVTLCDFEILQLGNVHRHTVQCVLPINLFNEKIYVLVWFWFVAVACVNFLSISRWAMTIGLRSKRIRYIRRHLKVMGHLDLEDCDRQLTIRFTETYLRRDGLFVLKLVAKNSTDLVVADIVAALWDNYRTKPGVLSGSDGLGMSPMGNNARRNSTYHDDENNPDDGGDKV